MFIHSLRTRLGGIIYQDVPQGSWVKSTNLVGSANVAAGPGHISRTFDRFPTFGGRPPLGSELNRDMRRY
ncbi:unnamed protein product [Cylicostephanus goldi]|uniref:Uncharacterized protein n=1 Tax=Cylicostephanus goldi TaxID=71465 RepID=A0A3P7QYL3_CYLGO|nr:unnamed protein product [Cylicostephanus goldi]